MVQQQARRSTGASKDQGQDATQDPTYEQAAGNAAAQQALIYVVESGDTLSGIAGELTGDTSRYPDLIDENPELAANPDLIEIGQQLELPEAWASGQAESGAMDTTSTNRQGTEYHSQRDNETDPDMTCNMSTVAMVITASLGSDNAAKQAVAALMEDAGKADPDMSKSVDDLLIELFDLWGDAHWKTESDALNGAYPLQDMQDADGNVVGFYEYWSQTGIRWREIHGCVIWALEALTGNDIQYDWNNQLDADYFLNTLKPTVDGGQQVLLGTGMAGDGHFVTLSEVMSTGIVVQDPYGTRIRDGHVRNGAQIAQPVDCKTATADESLQRRLALNPRAYDAISAGGYEIERAEDRGQDPKKLDTVLSHELGKDNLFTWDEVVLWGIGASAMYEV